MIATDISNTETVRNVFIIDDIGKIRAILIYPMNVGRGIAEILRLVQALQVADNNKASTPVNWMPCNSILIPPPNSFNKLLDRNEEIKQNGNGMNWYIGFKSPQNCSILQDIDTKSDNLV